MATSPKTRGVELPRAFVPALAATLERYLESLAAVVPKPQLEGTTRLVRDFASDEAKGNWLQEKLREFASTRDNWVTELWLDDMYLNNPQPLPVNSSPFYLLPKQNFKTSHEQVRYAARVVEFATLFKKRIDTGSLTQDISASRGKKTALCMQTYRHFFPAYRRPGFKKDELLLVSEQQDHIIVACRNQFFSLKLPMKNDHLSVDALEEQLLHVKQQAKDASEHQPSVGVLTTQDRRSWASHYSKLARCNVNQASLQSLETCLLIVCLDQPLHLRPNYSTIRRESFTLDLAAMAAHLLHGGSADANAANRWYDKFMQVVVSRDGVNGFICEHSASEGITLLRFCEELLDHLQQQPISKSPAKAPPNVSSLHQVTRLRWDLNEEFLAAIQDASKTMNKLAEDVDLYVLSFQNYGKEFIKAQKISPDVFIQLSLQLTYYKVHRKLVSTYESASLRKFHLGRVDNIRAATSQALEWVQAMCDAIPATEEDKIKLFQAAVDKATQILFYTVSGEGPDNHLLGLREMAKLHDMEVALFRDKSYTDYLDFRLSTSQLNTEKHIMVGYGPVVPDGYGCSYNICPNNVNFCVSSYFSSPETSSDFFALSLEGSLLQMRELCLKRQQAQSAEEERNHS
ncbi:choline O-acetyltransferase-like isoform X1 [Ornithodoros turicata]|uniref:choline O-acetyltransferase-like isoform X1 n=1 Tax=Ornithodoros turicata TaxID=34597 RepID=UPI003139798B